MQLPPDFIIHRIRTKTVVSSKTGKKIELIAHTGEPENPCGLEARRGGKVSERKSLTIQLAFLSSGWSPSCKERRRRSPRETDTGELLFSPLPRLEGKHQPFRSLWVISLGVEKHGAAGGRLKLNFFFFELPGANRGAEGQLMTAWGSPLSKHRRINEY